MNIVEVSVDARIYSDLKFQIPTANCDFFGILVLFQNRFCQGSLREYNFLEFGLVLLQKGQHVPRIDQTKEGAC